VCCRQLQSLEHSVVSDVRLILTILQQQHAVRSSESSGSSMMPDYREVGSETRFALVTPFISLSESLIFYVSGFVWNSILGSTPRQSVVFHTLSLQSLVCIKAKLKLPNFLERNLLFGKPSTDEALGKAECLA
jgi:hypothetical protein